MNPLRRNHFSFARRHVLVAALVSPRALRAGALGVSAAMVATSIATPALAQPADAKAPAAEAKARLAAGDKAAKGKAWEDALKEYAAANSASPSAAAQLGVANARYQLRQLVDAYEAYDELVKTYGKTLSKRDRTLADGRLKEIGQLTGYLSLRVSEAGAAVTVDTKAVGTTPVAALMRLMAGAHSVSVKKEGFLPYEQAVDVAANGKAIVEVTLQREPRTGHVVVREKTGQAIRVSIDGVDVGAAPHEADLEPGSHEFGGRSATLTAPKATVDVVKGKTTEVELVASAFIARLEVRTSDNKGLISVDGKPMAEGSFAGEVAVGPHLIAVTREGYERYENRVNLADKQTLLESVTLKQTGGSLANAKPQAAERAFEGIYGGITAAGYIMPGGSNHSLQSACDTLGASSCTSPNPLGAGLNAYVGYSFNPVGFELFFGGLVDAVAPKANFDGVKGSSINPLIAAPAREEAFTFVRAGGIGAIRVRASFQNSFARFSAAAGVGLAYKHIAMERTTTATDGTGAKNITIDKGKGYVSPGISLDLSMQLRMTPSFAFVVGGLMWMENAGQSAKSKASNERLVVLDPANPQVPTPLATPEYDMANGAQVYVGPYIGVQFGP